MKNMKPLFVLCMFTLLASVSLSAQSGVTYEEPGITSLMSKYKSQNQAKTHIKGFRIQVASTTDRAKIQQQAGLFQHHFPHLAANWINETPYYKLKVGAYETKLECTYELKQIQEHFPGAYMVVDNKIPIGEARGM